MKIQFVLGKIAFDQLENIDAIVCPTDPQLSGSGGLDAAIHQAAGPALAGEIKGKKLPEGEAYVSAGYDLGVKYIVHAAIPRAAAARQEDLYHVYRNVLSAIGHPHTETPCKTAAITLLGTGSCGWSCEQSLALLWKVILDYNRHYGSSYFGKSPLETLFVYYLPEASKAVFSYKNRTSQAFFSAPDQWGMRGDPYLWYALMDHFDDPNFNWISLHDFILEIQRFFHGKTGKWLCGDTQVYVEEWANGGMTSGWISSFMAQIGIPLLCSNLCRMQQGCFQKKASFIIPVTLRSMHETEYALTLPYELLDELTALRQESDKLMEQSRIMLEIGQPYYLTKYHFKNAPELVDHYSLDVEEASDSHYQFSEAAAADLCKSLGYMPVALGAALKNYLQEHGGPALESMIGKIADKVFHYD